MPEILPLFPLGTVLFPGMILPLHVFEPRYRTLFAARAELDPIFGVVLTRAGREVGEQPEIHQIGAAASLLRAVRYDDGRADLVVRGGRRFRVVDAHWGKGYLTAAVEWIVDDEFNDVSMALDRLAARVQRVFAAYLRDLARTTGQRLEPIEITGDPVDVAYIIGAVMPLNRAQRQQLLEAATPFALLDTLLRTLRRERELLNATGIGGAAMNHPGHGFSTN